MFGIRFNNEFLVRNFLLETKEVIFKKELQHFNPVNMSIQNLLIRARIDTALI